MFSSKVLPYFYLRNHGGAVVTHSPSTYEVCSSNFGPCVGKLAVGYRRLEVYSTELDQLYELFFSAHKTTYPNMTYTVSFISKCISNN